MSAEYSGPFHPSPAVQRVQKDREGGKIQEVGEVEAVHTGQENVTAVRCDGHKCKPVAKYPNFKHAAIVKCKDQLEVHFSSSVVTIQTVTK